MLATVYSQTFKYSYTPASFFRDCAYILMFSWLCSILNYHTRGSPFLWLLLPIFRSPSSICLIHHYLFIFRVIFQLHTHSFLADFFSGCTLIFFVSMAVESTVRFPCCQTSASWFSLRPFSPTATHGQPFVSLTVFPDLFFYLAVLPTFCCHGCSLNSLSSW